MGDVGIFLTEEMSKMASDATFDKQVWERLFQDTFSLIANGLSDKAFKRYDVPKAKFMGGFSLTAFEVIAFGIAYNISLGRVPVNLEEKAMSLWSNDQYTNWSGAGMTATRRLPHLIPLGRELLANGN